MLLIGHTHDVTFKVQVVGTAAEPTARLLLASNPMLCFPATKVGDQWLAAVRVPECISPGEYDLKVEVVINHRLFTPVTKRIEVQLQAPAVSEPVVATPSTGEAPPVELPPEPTISLVPAREEVEEVAPPPPAVKAPSLLATVTAAPMPEVATPAVREEKKPPKKWPKLEPLMPKKPTTAPSPVKVSLLEIAKETAGTPMKPVTKAPPPPVVEMAPGVPVFLEKGTVVYE